MRTIAFYLPQFHQIPENDEWWGEGFTEWTNVRRAKPMFDGHSHPRKPGPLGEYDLLNPEVHRAQSELARTYGVDAFCMYFYWFNGRRLLEKPIDMWQSDANLLPYCLSWANESWTRRWDGGSQHVLMPQDYEPGFEEEIFTDLLPHFSAPHYLHQHGNPVLVVHRADLIPDPPQFASKLRRLARAEGLSGIHLVAAETMPGLRPETIGFDALAEFPPVGSNTLRCAQLAPVADLDTNFRGRLLSYPRIADRFTRRRAPKFVRYRGVMPAWDNTARRQHDATIYVGASPERYAVWLAHARKAELAERGADGLVFINAWNEWAEGAYLEPDTDHGHRYLDATRGGDIGVHSVIRPTARRRRWSVTQIRSLVLIAGGTALATFRRIRQRLRR